MKTQLLKTIGLFFLAFIFINCTNNDNLITLVEVEDQLPPITQTGANTFGCLINGKVFIPKDKTGYTPPGGGRPKGLSVGIGTPTYFTMVARNYLDIYINIYIPNDTPLEQVYTFKISSGLPSGLDAPNYPHAYIVYNGFKHVTFENSGTITFTKADSNTRVYAGTFEIKTKSETNENLIIELTQGRFDIDLNTLNN